VAWVNVPRSAIVVACRVEANIMAACVGADGEGGEESIESWVY